MISLYQLCLNVIVSKIYSPLLPFDLLPATILQDIFGKYLECTEEMESIDTTGGDDNIYYDFLL